MAKRRKNTWIWWVGGIVLLLAALALGKQAGWIGKKSLVQVSTTAVARRDITEVVTASGKIQPEVQVKISPDVSGEIIELTVKEGDSVRAGQLLCRIRPDNYRSLVDRAAAAVQASRANLLQSQAALGNAKVRLAQAEIEYKRNEKLFADKVISDVDWQSIVASYKGAKQDVESGEASVKAAQFNVESNIATLKDAQENLRKTTIFSPVKGTISKLAVELGERVVGTSQMAGTEMMIIANLKNMEVLVDVNENDVVRLALGDTALIDVDSYSDHRFAGVVTAIANTAKNTTSLDVATEFEVKVRILNESYQDLLSRAGGASPFRPGMTASVEIITNRKKGVLSVPLASVTTKPLAELDTLKKESEKTEAKRSDDDQVEVVWVQAGGKAQLRQVKTGISDIENIEVLSGLKEGEEIISGPFLAITKQLKPGAAVEPEKKAKPKEKE